MSIHLGNSTIGLTYNGISSENLNALKKAVYNSTGVTATNIPAMVNALTPYESDVEAALPEPTEWVRPAAWPDLDSLNLPESGDDYIYMTYDLNINPGAISLNFSGSDIVVTVGHIENGTYVVDETVPSTSTTCYYWLDNYTGYVVIRITGSIKYCVNVEVPAASRPADGRTQTYYNAPLVERYAYLPHATRFYGSSTNNTRWGSVWLEHERLSNNEGNTTLTNINVLYSYCYNLQKIEIEHLYTQNVTNISALMQYCYRLSNFKAPAWDLKKCTNFANMFYYCENMTDCDLSAIETTSGKITTIASMFQYCYKLRHIIGLNKIKVDSTTTNLTGVFMQCKTLTDISDAFNWTPAPTSLDSLFFRCSSLKYIDISKWDCTNVTNCASTFNTCYSLEKIVFPQFGENVTTCGSMFYECVRLTDCNIENLTLSNKCAKFNNMFYHCYNIETLDLSHWDVSGGDTFANMFDTCHQLKVLDLTNWEISDACTTLASMFYVCRQLEVLKVDFSDWDTSNVTTVSSMFNSCNNLQGPLDFSGWDVSNITTCASMCRYAYNLKEVNIKNWSLDSVTSIQYIFDSCNNLETIKSTGVTINSAITTIGLIGGDNYRLINFDGLSFPISATYSNLACITHESLLNMLNALPEVSKAQTLKIGVLALGRLTDTEKAIATNKGWTLAS